MTVATALLATVLVGRMGERSVARAYRTPEPEKPLVQVTFDRRHGNYVLPSERLTVSNWQLPAAFHCPTRSVALGIPLALGLTRVMSGVLSGANANAPVRIRMLTEASSLPPLSYVARAVALTAGALLACYFPAHRANKVHPVEALRYE